jgi:hypothetical protein
MTKEELIEIAEQVYGKCAWHGDALNHLEQLAKLVAQHERKKIKHFLTATSVSVQTRVYIGDEEISMLKMTHEEIKARGQE